MTTIEPVQVFVIETWKSLFNKKSIEQIRELNPKMIYVLDSSMNELSTNEKLKQEKFKKNVKMLNEVFPGAPVEVAQVHSWKWR
jgi:hypothetical protein